MTTNLHDLEPWELQDESRINRYRRGTFLIHRYGTVDLTDKFAIGGLREWLSLEEFRDYILALEYVNAVAARKLTHHQRPSAPQPQALQTVQPQGSLPAEPATQSKPNLPPDLSADDLVEAAIDRFVASKKLTAESATAEKYGAQCRMFLKVVANGRTNLMISELSAKDLRAYADALPKLPTRIDSTDQRPLEQILKLTSPTLSSKTVFSHAQATNMFLTWCAAQQYPIQIAFHGILKPLLKKPKVRNKKKAFSKQQLKTLFESDAYTIGTFKRASDYWVPLLGLFTGAREAELCQLEVSDVRRDAATGLWLLDINSDQDKKLKTDTSAREVPLHPKLVELGFLDFVTQVATANKARLFSDEERNKRGEFGNFSKRFNRYKEGLGIKTDPHNKLDFHSFRHTLQTLLFEKGEEEYIVNALCGHSTARRSEGVRTYSRGPGLKAKYEVLLKLEFGIDFDKIKPNGWTCFQSEI